MISRADREFVTARAKSRCEYCRAPEVVTGVTFHVEHIIPNARGGLDEYTNYALSCVSCNGHKSDSPSALDPKTGAEILLFHPRLDRWKHHFQFEKEALVICGISAKGRATVAKLQMNQRKQIEARELWVKLEIYP